MNISLVFDALEKAASSNNEELAISLEFSKKVLQYEIENIKLTQPRYKEPYNSMLHEFTEEYFEEGE